MPRGAERAERRPLPAAASHGGDGDRVVRRRPGAAAGPSRDGAATQPRRVTRAGGARRGRRGRGVRESGAHPRCIDIECDPRVAGIAVSGAETGREPQTRPVGRLPRHRGRRCGWTRRSSDALTVAATASAKGAAAHSGIQPLWSRRTEGDEGVVRGRRWPQRPQAWVASSASAAADAELATTTGGKNAGGRRGGRFSGQWCSGGGHPRGSTRNACGVRLSDRTSQRGPSHESAWRRSC